MTWPWPGSICPSSRALQAPGAPLTAREGGVDPPVGSLQAGGSRGVCYHVRVCGVRVSVCEMKTRGSAPIPQSSSSPCCVQRGHRPRSPGQTAVVPPGSLSARAAAAPPLPPSLPWSTSIPCEPWGNVAPLATWGDAPAPVRGSGGHPFRAWGCGGGACSPGAVTVVGGHPAPSHFSLSLA